MQTGASNVAIFRFEDDCADGHVTELLLRLLASARTSADIATNFGIHFHGAERVEVLRLVRTQKESRGFENHAQFILSGVGSRGGSEGSIEPPPAPTIRKL